GAGRIGHAPGPAGGPRDPVGNGSRAPGGGPAPDRAARGGWLGPRRRLHRRHAGGAGHGGPRDLARGRDRHGGVPRLGDPGGAGPAADGRGRPPDAQRPGAGGERRGGVRAAGGADAGAAVGRAARPGGVARAACDDGGARSRAGSAGRGPGDRPTAHCAGGGGMSAALDLRSPARTGPVHFLVTSGAGVSALAEVVLSPGGRVTGCDLKPGAVGDALRRLGAAIVEGHDPAHVTDAVALVTTSAVPQDHPELVEARQRGIPVLKRAEALGALVNRGEVLAVAGTHGKTTTTAMAAAILEEAGLDPTAFV